MAMTLKKLTRRLERVVPGSAIEELTNGEIVIYTGHRLDETDTLVSMTQEEINQ